MKTPMVMWRVSKGASRKYELIWMKKQIVIARKRLEAVVEAEGGYIEKK